MTFKCLSLTFDCLSVIFHRLSVTFHCLSWTFHCISLTFHCLSGYRNPDLHTPKLDQLAKDGLILEEYYVTTPVVSL